ncbi:LCP family protein [Halobacillus salinus]|uniref:LytR family transcriptional regulator n=1 Tax=Halobacillus salinus TaxID=192814 RepID=A0A4Z0GX57_9BACI|nr:LCP family protein [Halobacillus salinus]TGB02380.1 LytR family transcriptional regulator [Halobacillus salinus]
MKNRKFKILLWTIPAVLLLGIGAAAGYIAYVTQEVKETVTASHVELDRGEKSKMRVETVNPVADHTSVLFVGVDDSEKRSSGGDRSALSDALILATFNNDDQSVKMLSIPRDSYTYIPEIGYKDKITHAHAFGGIDATVEAVEGLLNVPVDYYVRLNFNSFVDFVNSIGGVEYDVPFALTEQNSRDNNGAIELEEGEQTLNGEEALALARTRKYDNDLKRGQRQMELVQEIVKQSISTNTVRNLDDILQSIEDNMSTNLSFSQIIQFNKYFTQKDNLAFDTMQLTGEGMYKEGIWYFDVNEQNLQEKTATLQSHLELGGSVTETATDDDPDNEESS